MAKRKNTPKHQQAAKKSTKTKTVKKKKKITKPKPPIVKPLAIGWWKEPKIFLTVLGIIIATLALYYSSLSNGFMTYWDDYLYVTQNQHITSVSWENIKYIFTNQIAANYHPLTILSLMIDYQIADLKPFTYHLHTLLLHIGCAVLTFYFVFLLTRGKIIVAGLTALLFAIHPMHVESVCWTAERKDVLYGFYFMGGLIAYLKYLETRKLGFYVFTLFLAACSILSKPAAVVFPAVLLLLDYFWDRIFPKNKLTFEGLGKVLLEKLPFIALCIGVGLATIQIQADEAVGSLGAYTLWQRIMFATRNIVVYMSMLLVPINVSGFYPLPLPHESLPLIYKIAPVITLFLVGLVLFSLRKMKIIAFGFAFFLGTIALVLQFINVGDAIMANRYTYLPYTGLFIILGYGLDYLVNHQKEKVVKLGYMVSLLFLIYAAWLSYLAFERTKTWKDSVTMWTDVIRVFPNSYTAYYGRGNHYYTMDELIPAFNDYTKAISIKPDNDYRAYHNRALIYYRTKKYEEAWKDISIALQVKADYGPSLFLRSNLNKRKGRKAEALQDALNARKYGENVTEEYIKSVQ